MTAVFWCAAVSQAPGWRGVSRAKHDISMYFQGRMSRLHAFSMFRARNTALLQGTRHRGVPRIDRSGKGPFSPLPYPLRLFRKGGL